MMLVFFNVCYYVMHLSAASSVLRGQHGHDGHGRDGQDNKNENQQLLFKLNDNEFGEITDLDSLIIANDGPTVLGANTTYYATFSSLPDPNIKYICYWSELKCGKLLPYWSTTYLISNKCNTSSIYACTQDLGTHTMMLRILQKGSLKEIATSLSTVEITEYMNVNLTVQQEDTVCNTTDKCLVTTKNSMQMNVDIHDPSNFFKDAFIKYDWTFGDGQSDLILEPTADHSYSSPGIYKVQVNLTAILDEDEDRIEKNGYLTYYIDALDAITNLTIKGSSESTVGSVGQYNVSCNGSVPVSFCWSVVHNPTIDNNTCIWTLSSPFCNDTFKYRFNNTGTYHLSVKAINDVSQQISETSIDVGIAPVAAYSSIAAAIIFGIILSLISIAVVVHSYRKEKMRHVEVANFDFQSDETNESSLSSFARRLRTMVTPPLSTMEERLNLLSKKQPNVARELDLL